MHIFIERPSAEALRIGSRSAFHRGSSSDADDRPPWFMSSGKKDHLVGGDRWIMLRENRHRQPNDHPANRLRRRCLLCLSRDNHLACSKIYDRKTGQFLTSTRWSPQDLVPVCRRHRLLHPSFWCLGSRCPMIAIATSSFEMTASWVTHSYSDSG